MNTTEKGVENAVSLSFMMVNLSAKMLQNGGQKYEGILDLKTHYRGVKYAEEAIKIVQEKAEPILIKETIEEIKERLSKLGSIHQPKMSASTP